jgi:hypothetical protein
MPTRSSRSIWDAVQEADGWSVWRDGRMERRIHDDLDSAIRHVRAAGGHEVIVTHLDGVIELLGAD